MVARRTPLHRALLPWRANRSVVAAGAASSVRCDAPRATAAAVKARSQWLHLCAPLAVAVAAVCETVRGHGLRPPIALNTSAHGEAPGTRNVE